MLIRQRRHLHGGIFICLCFAQCLSVKVNKDSPLIRGTEAAELSKVPHATPAERHPQPLLHPGTPSQNNVGSKGLRARHASGNGAATMADSMATARHGSDALEATTRLRKSSSTSSLVLISLLGLWVLVAVGFLMAPGGGGSEYASPRSDHSTPGKKAYAPNNALSTSYETPLPQPLSRNGSSFATRYQQSKGQDRTALELLLRCNVIPQEEFHSNSVSHEHIEECIWVAKVMLLQKPLEVWVALGHEDGQKSFQEVVAGMNSAREVARVNAAAMEPPEKPVARANAPDSPNDMMFSPGSRSLNKDGTAVSFGSSVSFGVEEQDKDPVAGNGPSVPTSPQTMHSAGAVLNTMPSDTPADVAALYQTREMPQRFPREAPAFTTVPRSPTGALPGTIPFPAAGAMPPTIPQGVFRPNTQTSISGSMAGSMAGSQFGSTSGKSPLPEKSPVPLLNCYSQAEANAPPSSNSDLGQASAMPTASSLGGGASEPFQLVLTPSPSGLERQPPPTQEAMVLTPPMSGSGTPGTGCQPPPKLFSFVPQEVMLPPPEPPLEEQWNRPPSSTASMPVSLRSLPDAAARRLQPMPNPDYNR
jgi:hypothetical protein